MKTSNEAVNCTEYKIGNTTYYVETHFNLQAESLDEIIERLIGKDEENIRQHRTSRQCRDMKFYHFKALNFTKKCDILFSYPL